MYIEIVVFSTYIHVNQLASPLRWVERGGWYKPIYFILHICYVLWVCYWGWNLGQIYYPYIYYRTGSHGCRLFIYVNFGLTNTANADNFIIWNDFVFINNALVQVKSNLTLKYHNQYFYFRVIHFNSRPSQLICRLPIDLVVLRRSASLYNLIMLWGLNAHSMEKSTKILSSSK